MSLKQNQEGSTYINKLEFLLQSTVLQVDDELLGWVSKFAGSVSKSMGTTNAMVHRIFKPRKARRMPEE